MKIMSSNDKYADLALKPMKSLLSSSPNGSNRVRLNDDTYNATSGSSGQKTSIAAPTNILPTSTHTIVPDASILEPKAKLRKTKKFSQLHKKKIINSLDLKYNKHHENLDIINLNKKEKLPKEKRKKKDIYIHELGQRESGMLNLTSENNEMDSLMKEFNVDEMEEKSKNLRNQLNVYLESKEKREKKKEREKENDKLTKLTSGYLCQQPSDSTTTLLDLETSKDAAQTIESFHIKNNQPGNKSDEMSLQSLINNKDKYNEVKRKFEKRKPYINPNIINSINDIEIIINKYRNVLIDILNGKTGSYFYNEAKKLQQSSSLMNIKGDEIHNLKKDKYYGYIGAVRGFHIGKMIEQDEELLALLKEKLKLSNVIKFWGIDNFTQYVLAPEVIAHISLNTGNLEDMDAAYDELEETNDYGMFVTNTIELKCKEDDLLELDDEASDNNYKVEKENSDNDSNIASIILSSDDEEDFMKHVLEKTK
jgi:hypothetical protein